MRRIRGATMLLAATIFPACGQFGLGITGDKSYMEHKMVQDADLIVLGSLRTMHSFPWFDGIHLGGTIAVNEVLYGSAQNTRLELRDVCRWASHCDIRLWLRNPNPYPDFVRQSALWFLKRAEDGSWRASWFDVASRRADYEDYIRRYKR